MTDLQLTQCPHCKASFKVSEEQLAVANGRVRCGACLNIFDAIAYRINPPLIDKEDEAFSRKMNSLDDDLSYLEDSVDLENELLDNSDKELEKDPPEQFDEFADEALFADDPEEDKLEKGYAGSSKFSDELSTSFREVEKPTGSPFSADSLNDDFLPTEDEKDDAIDESWASSILDDLDEPERQPIEADKPGTAVRSSTSAPSTSPGSLAEASTKHDARQTPDPLLELSAALSENSPSDALAMDKSDISALNFQYQQDRPSPLRWLGWCFFALINLALLLVLIAQASWYHYEKLVKYPKVAALYEFACQHIGCTLPELKDLSKIENRNLVVKSHPTVHKALIIETIITNQAGFDQPFPDISLAFSDINNNIIAQRLFRPREYLTSDLNQWSAMPSRQPIQITLEIIDPGPQAVNYKVAFYPSRSF